MTDDIYPVLYSFRRCPYAMRARMALMASQTTCVLREVVLRDKPAEMIAASPKATVPVLIDVDGTVRDESLDIMLWALSRHDPAQLLAPMEDDLPAMLEMIGMIDTSFKFHLDRYKYATRFPADTGTGHVDPIEHRATGLCCLAPLDLRLTRSTYLFGARPTLADIAIAPFVRQFANTDIAWFSRQDSRHLQRWLEAFLKSPLFQAVMQKYAQWRPGDASVLFGGKGVEAL